MAITLTFKTMQQKQFKVEAELDDTVAKLKEKIEALNGSPAAHQKIIYSGKILADDKTVGECSIKEKDFLVLMVSKPKVAAAPAASTSAAGASTSSGPAEPTVPAPVAAADTTMAPPPDQATPAPAEAAVTASGSPPEDGSAPPAAAQAAFGDMSSFVTGAALQNTINEIVNMGFPRDQVIVALRASFNNPDRAVDYLMSGIPPHLLAEANPPPAANPTPARNPPAPSALPVPAAPQPAAQQPAVPATGNLFQAAQAAAQANAGAPAAGGGGAGARGRSGPAIDLAALQNSPVFDQIRQMVQQNPALLQPLIQQLAASQPGLAQALNDNPEVLYQLLAGGPPGSAADAGMQGEDDGEDEGAIPPGAQVIQVSPEERDAIERLIALGFPRQAAIEAYFACGKNEELAANFLFEGGFE